MNHIKPYEKFMKMGAESLTDAELLAIILRTGTSNKDALSLAEEILSLNGTDENLLTLYNLTAEDLQKIKGIGEVKAVKLLCITEISKRISMQKTKVNLCLSSPSSIASYFMEQLRHKKTECLVLLCLDNKCKMICHDIITSGSVRMSLVPPREIFLEALHRKAVNIVLLHNHPSGDPTPSESDYESTKKISELGELLGIPLLDHIVIGDNVYFSFAEHNDL